MHARKHVRDSVRFVEKFNITRSNDLTDASVLPCNAPPFIEKQLIKWIRSKAGLKYLFFFQITFMYRG